VPRPKQFLVWPGQAFFWLEWTKLLFEPFTMSQRSAALLPAPIDRNWPCSYYREVRLAALPPRSMVGQLPLEQHIGVRIPGGQPIMHFLKLP
jgi:hypothetical protein